MTTKKREVRALGFRQIGTLGPNKSHLFLTSWTLFLKHKSGNRFLGKTSSSQLTLKRINHLDLTNLV